MASNTWKPSVILEIEELTNNFHCIGHTKHTKPCENPIKKENRIRAEGILRAMSTTSPASNTYDEEIAELVRMLLCWRHKEDTTQLDDLTGKWTRAIERFARKSGNVMMMGEADDTIGSLDADISDLMERRLRLVELGRAQGQSGGRGAGERASRS